MRDGQQMLTELCQLGRQWHDAHICKVPGSLKAEKVPFNTQVECGRTNPSVLTCSPGSVNGDLPAGSRKPTEPEFTSRWEQAVADSPPQHTCSWDNGLSEPKDETWWGF